MRKTVNLEDDVHELASAHAAARDITLGAAICELIRRSHPSLLRSELVISDSGFPLSCHEEEGITEMVDAAHADEID